MQRRRFLKAVGGATSGLAFAAPPLVAAEGPVPEADRVEGLPRRMLGRTGQKLSVVGFPGLALIHHDQDRCTQGLRSALDRGVNYFDVAPAYGKGQCETKMGLGLQGVDRSRYFLACKTKVRDKAGARAELEVSLIFPSHHSARGPTTARPGTDLRVAVPARGTGSRLSTPDRPTRLRPRPACRLLWALVVAGRPTSSPRRSAKAVPGHGNCETVDDCSPGDGLRTSFAWFREIGWLSPVIFERSP